MYQNLSEEEKKKVSIIVNVIRISEEEKEKKVEQIII